MRWRSPIWRRASLRRSRAVVVWAPSEARAELFARRLGADLHRIHFLRYKRPLFAPAKYVPQAIVTLCRLFRDRPAFVYVTNPPVFAAMTVAFYARVSGARFVMDTHPPALFARKWSWTTPLQRWMARAASCNIVDQERFRRRFEGWGARTIVLEQPPRSPRTSSDARPSDRRVTVINTFAADEPLECLLEAARLLPDVEFRILGEAERAPRRLRGSAPSNVVFPGYLHGEDYAAELSAASVIVALTTYPYSLLAAIQDAQAVGKPLVTSDQPVLREYLGDAAVFVTNDGASVGRGVEQALENRHELCRRITGLRVEKYRRWEQSFEELAALADEAQETSKR